MATVPYNFIVFKVLLYHRWLPLQVSARDGYTGKRLSDAENVDDVHNMHGMDDVHTGTVSEHAEVAVQGQKIM